MNLHYKYVHPILWTEEERKERLYTQSPGHTCIMLYISMKNKTFGQLIRLPCTLCELLLHKIETAKNHKNRKLDNMIYLTKSDYLHFPSHG